MAIDVGLYFQTVSSVVVTDVTIADCAVGIYPMVIRPSATSHEYAEKTVTIQVISFTAPINNIINQLGFPASISFLQDRNHE